MVKFRSLALLLLAVVGTAVIASAGCVNLKAPEQINVGTGRHEPVDASKVPPTSSHEEARQKLAEAYGEIQHLQSKVAGLERDKRELKAEREECEKKYKKLKDRHDD